jgi:FtsH-binding integral membrane protein
MKFIGDVFQNAGLMSLIYAGISSGWLSDPALFNPWIMLGLWLLFLTIGAWLRVHAQRSRSAVSDGVNPYRRAP